MKFEGTIEIECFRPDIVEKSYLKYEKDCSEVKAVENKIAVTVKGDSERLFKKTLTSTMDKIFLSVNTIEFCMKNDKEADEE